jgi:hypothetical protein
MPRMIELIRQSAVPANLMRAAARGALSLPLAEMVEVLVHLTSVPLFAQQAALTLAGWNEAALAPVVASAETPPEVLGYFLAPTNFRPALLPALLENPAVSEARVAMLVSALAPSDLSLVLGSSRARSMALVLNALLRRPELAEADAKALRADLERLSEAGSAIGRETAEDDGPHIESDEDILDPGLAAYLHEHAAEIAAAEGPFQLVAPSQTEQAEIAAVQAGGASSLAARALAAEPRERLSPVQKISRLSVGERVQLALKGNREERLILVRDSAKVVSNAVLQSPRVTEQDIDLFASMRNVGEHVLRGISMNRRFMRRYAVKRILASNPRAPIDVAMLLVKELLVSDLDQLSKNKNVSEMVRRFAWKVLRNKKE